MGLDINIKSQPAYVVELLKRGPQGLQGIQGEQGPIGPMGPAGTTSWDDLTNIPTDLVYDADYTHTDNNFTDSDETKLSGIADGAEVNVIEVVKRNGVALTVTDKEVDVTVPTALSDLTGDSTHRTVTDAEKSNWNTAYSEAHTHSNKTILDNTTASFTTAQETKLEGIEAGAQVNVNADWDSISGDSLILNKPTNVSVFYNDAGYLTVETDPIFTAWLATNPLSPYALTSSVPTKTSDLTNDSGFITASAISKRSLQIKGDLRSAYMNSRYLNLLDMVTGTAIFPNGIKITSWYVDCSVASPTTQLSAQLRVCNALGGGGFPNATNSLLATLNTTSGNSSATGQNITVATNKIIYIDMTADPTDFNTNWFITINFEVL